ncbi:hypothetical protein yc1106_01953 [Curvularia clavata]|uniref:Histidinol-phosphatase n=1 Tax=Curvularia clavata TaxID=95742 RepID=A0A9Q9DQH0_CURCL|nr:hypothetical protein yc1106_01953 [Curvularia clavata]
MPYSHHSHSGQFCSHAKDTLEQVIQAAIAKGFHSFALTEHIPRPIEDFYPGEADSYTVESLAKTFDDFIVEAHRLRDAYSDQMQILIGFETEWIRPSTLELIRGILDKYTFDFFMGSVHHVHTIPIDFDRKTYEQAREKAGGTDERLFEDYFDAQFEMLQELRPAVVGHLDLIRLLSDHRDDCFKDMAGVWEKIQRNLEFIASYGGLLELNSAGLRKGLTEPYPCLPICQMFLRMGGGFVMSDDSHGIDHIGTNYARLLEFVKRVGIDRMHYVEPAGQGKDSGISSIALTDLVQLPFWGNLD